MFQVTWPCPSSLTQGQALAFPTSWPFLHGLAFLTSSARVCG